MAKAADESKRKAYRGSMGINLALEQKMIKGAATQRKSVAEDAGAVASVAAATVANLAGPLDLAADLAARFVGATIFRPSAQAFRLIVELLCRDDLWKWAKRSDNELLLARLRPENLHYGLAQARKVLRSACKTADGDLTITFRDLTDQGISLDVVIRGPRGSALDGTFHLMELELPAEWPHTPPRARLTSPMYHCNICDDGMIPPGALGLLEDDWDASKTIFTYLS